MSAVENANSRPEDFDGVRGALRPPDPVPRRAGAPAAAAVGGVVDGPMFVAVVVALAGGAVDGTRPPDRFTNTSVVVLVGIVGAGLATEGSGATGAVVPPGVVMTADAMAVGATTVMAATVSAPSARWRRACERAWGQ